MTKCHLTKIARRWQLRHVVFGSRQTTGFPQAKELAKGMIYQLGEYYRTQNDSEMKDCYSMVFTHMQKEKGLMNPIYGAIIFTWKP